MTSSTLSLQPSLSRRFLRFGLLAGALLDSVFVLMALGSLLPVGRLDSLLANSVSYSWQWAAPLACRAAIQMLACYDRQRYEGMVPIISLSLVGSGMAGFASGLPSTAATALIVLGAVQLISLPMSRR